MKLKCILLTSIAFVCHGLVPAIASAENAIATPLFSSRAQRQLMAYAPVTGILPSGSKFEKNSSDKKLASVSSTPLCENGALPRDEVKQLVLAEASRQKVDELLALAIVAEESDFGRNVNSKAGARGIMQLMPKTAHAYGVTSICDPKQNIEGGVGFLKDLTARFDGNILLIAAAYNAGEERVLRTRGIPAFPETVNYTAKVVNRYYNFDNFLNRNKKAAVENAVAGSSTSPATPMKDAGRQEWIGGSVLIVN